MSSSAEHGSRTADLGTHPPAPAERAGSQFQTPTDATDPAQSASTLPSLAADERATVPIPAPGHHDALSGAKVGASALTAVTTAVVASHLGPAGTLVGAALGAALSTVATAFWTRSLERGGDRLRQTTSVVVQRVPRGRNRTPDDIVGTTAATQAIPPLDRTTVMPTVTGAAAGAPPVSPPASPAARTTDAGGRRGTGPWGRRVALAGGGFVIAMGAIAGAEALIGHPISGGTGGSTIGDVTGKSTTTHSTPAVTSRPAASTGTPTATATPSATGSATPTATAAPSTSATATAAPTAGPTSQPSASQPAASGSANAGGAGTAVASPTG